MKPFNLDNALKGGALVTRDGREVKHFQENPSGEQDHLKVGAYRYFAMVDDMKESYTEEGRFWRYARDSRYDLFMKD